LRNLNALKYLLLTNNDISKSTGCVQNIDINTDSSKLSNSHKSSEDFDSTCTLEMEVECKQEPQESDAGNDSQEKSVSNTMHQISCVKSIPTATSTKQIILGTPVTGSSQVVWTPVVNTSQVLETTKTVVRSPQSLPSLPTTTINVPVNVPFPVHVIPNVGNIQPSTTQGQSLSYIPKPT